MRGFKPRARAFTLVEIILVVGIAAIIFSAGIAPLLFIVRVLGEARDAFTAGGRERAAFNRMVQDIREASLINSASPVTISKLEELGIEERDILIVRTVTPAYSGTYMGYVVYAVTDNEERFGGDGKTALRRWVISEDIPSGIDRLEFLAKEESSEIITDDIEGLTFETFRKSEWEEDYIGGVPQAIRAVFRYAGDRESIHEAWFPNS